MALALLLLAGSGCISSGPAGADEQAVTHVVSLPPARVGDYVRYAETNSSEPLSGAEDVWGRGRWYGDLQLTIRTVTQSVDHRGELRNVVNATVVQDVQGKGYFANGTMYVALPERVVVRTDGRPLMTHEGFDVQTYFPTHPWAYSGVLPLLNVSGRSLALGPDPDDELRQHFAAVLGLNPKTLNATARGLEWSTLHGQVGGQEAWGLVSTVTWTKPYWSRSLLRHYDVEYQTVNEMWLSEKVPYPVLIERRHTVRFVETGQTVEAWSRQAQVVTYEAGSHPIPWDLPAPPALLLDRSPAQQAYPADGPTVTFEYPLAAALSAVASDPTLVNLKLWQSQHPKNTLVGAQLWPKGAEPSTTRALVNDSGSEWSLLFASDDGSAFRVASFRPVGAQRVQNTDHGGGYGEAPAPSMDFEKIARAPLTWSALEKLWRHAVPHEEYRHLVANRAEWGYSDARCETNGCRFLGNATRMKIGHLRAEGGSVYVGDPFTSRVLGAVGPKVQVASYLGVDDSAQPEPSLRGGGHAMKDRPLIVNGDARDASTPEFKTLAPGSAEVWERFALGAVAAGAVVTGLAALLKVLGGPLMQFVECFARIGKDAMLDHKTREQILEAIRADAGVSRKELRVRLGLRWSTMVYHVRRLLETGHIHEVRSGRQKGLFLNEAAARQEHVQKALLRAPQARRCLDLIVASPGIGQRELAKALGIAVPSLLRHLRRLADACLIVPMKEAGRVRYLPMMQARHPVAAQHSTIFVGF